MYFVSFCFAICIRSRVCARFDDTCFCVYFVLAILIQIYNLHKHIHTNHIRCNLNIFLWFWHPVPPKKPDSTTPNQQLPSTFKHFTKLQILSHTLPWNMRSVITRLWTTWLDQTKRNQRTFNTQHAKALFQGSTSPPPVYTKRTRLQHTTHQYLFCYYM